MIIRVQISQNDDGQMTVIYNQGRSVVGQFPTTPEIRKLMGDSPKKYFHVKSVGDKIKILRPAPIQDW